MQVKDIVRIFIKGGILSPSKFLKIIEQAEKLGATSLHLGSRQDILFQTKVVDVEMLNQSFGKINCKYEINTFNRQNIVSSYIALDLMPTKKWVASHVYLEVLDSFQYDPAVRINICDPSQGLVPLFNGHINFIASDLENYWYVYLYFREMGQKPFQIPALVYTKDIPNVARFFEQAYFEKSFTNYQEVPSFIQEQLHIESQPVKDKLTLPDNIFPYYEGFNKYKDNQYWLGMYWRNNQHEISILKTICERCLAKDIGTICLSPWKSFVIKGIVEKDRLGWEILMGKLGLNLRHSAIEMNWHLPALDHEAMDLKAYLVQQMDKQDISTHGLTFTIKTTNDIRLFTSIVIERNLKNKDEQTYNILHSKGFNINENQYIIFVTDIPKESITPLLIDLSKIYYDELKNVDESKGYIEKVGLSMGSNTNYKN